VKRKQVPEADDQIPSGISTILSNKYYVDELYDALITKPLNALSDFAYRFVELRGIDAIVNGVSKSLTGLSGVLKFSQTGYTGGYIFSMVIGIILILVLSLMA